MRTSPALRQQLTQLIGPEAYLPVHEPHESHEPYKLNKSAVAAFLLTSEENAHAIDAIVHPAVAADFEASGAQWMECAILYESGFDRLVDKVIVVTAPLEVRISRIMQRDAITREKALEWIHRQWSQDEVRCRADYEIVNDGCADLNRQIDEILQRL